MKKPEIRNIALDIAFHPYGAHGSGPAAVMTYLEEYSTVRSLGDFDGLWKIEELCATSKVNTIFLMPCAGDWETLLETFIIKIRDQYPTVVFVLFMTEDNFKSLCSRNNRFEHYFFVDSSGPYNTNGDLQKVIEKCKKWHWRQYEFDVCLSFAGENRNVAENIASQLKELNLKVFYDADFQSRLWGRDLSEYLHEVYSLKSRFCIPIISNYYKLKAWTVYERKASLERAIKDRGSEYILPFRLDDTKISGIFESLGYLSEKQGLDSVAKLAGEKIGLYGYGRYKEILR